MSLRPIFSTLRRHKLTATLLALQVAFTCAIVCNVAFMMAGRVQRISVPTGIAESELSLIWSTGTQSGAAARAQHETDLAALRGVPGVRSAVAVNSALPLGRSDVSYGTCPDMEAVRRMSQTRSIDDTGCLAASIYSGTAGLISTWGLSLIEGRDFQPDDFVPMTQTPAVAIISRGLAEALYPGKSALGQQMQTGGKVVRVVGIVDTLLRPSLRKPGLDQHSMIWPRHVDGPNVLYVLRSASADRQRVLQAATAALLKVDPNRLIASDDVQTYSELRAEYFQRDATMISLLLASVLGLLFVTALGITGLANFWVQQRTRSIGIRRAVGATRGDILRYFQTENFLIVSVGVGLGLLFAVALNAQLMQHFEFNRLPWFYLPIGALALWSLGQLAVLGPALRAANVPPVVATRSV